MHICDDICRVLLHIGEIVDICVEYLSTCPAKSHPYLCISVHILHTGTYLTYLTYLAYRHISVHITMQVIASVEKYENARMKFSTVPAFALAESRASDACCLFLVQKHTAAKSACFPPQESSDQVLELIADVATHSLDPRAATRAVPVRNLPAAAHAALL